MKHKGLNQLLSAATINNRFCDTLLHDPAEALTAGYFGQAFSLTPEERDLVIGIHAQRLEDFAEQIHCWMRLNRNGHSGNGHGNNGYQRQRFGLVNLDCN